MSNEHKPGSPLYPSHRLDTLEPHYSRHVSAMTTEQLHSKADIAKQLAWRDQALERLRARVGELEAGLGKLSESLGPRPFHLPDATLSEVVEWQVASTLRALKHETNEHDRHHKVEEQQAARITDLECQLAAAREEQTRLRGLFDTTRHLVLRSMGVEDMGHGWFWIESELAAAREEQGLEAKVREVLGERFGLLNLHRLFSGHWRAEWGSARRAHAATLPALLRAILEQEAS